MTILSMLNYSLGVNQKKKKKKKGDIFFSLPGGRHAVENLYIILEQRGLRQKIFVPLV